VNGKPSSEVKDGKTCFFQSFARISGKSIESTFKINSSSMALTVFFTASGIFLTASFNFSFREASIEDLLINWIYINQENLAIYPSKEALYRTSFLNIFVAFLFF
jgi:hypothetical protein